MSTSTPELQLETTAFDEAGAPALTVDDLTTAAGLVRDEPTVAPTQTEQDGLAAQAVGAAAWSNGKTITATWSNSSNRNAFAAVAGLGWRRINPARDGSFVTLTAIMAHAEQTGRPTNLLIDDNVIIEAYVL